jgi:hypothetical protein
MLMDYECPHFDPLWIRTKELDIEITFKKMYLIECKLSIHMEVVLKGSGIVST